MSEDTYDVRTFNKWFRESDLPGSAIEATWAAWCAWYDYMRGDK